MNTKNNVFSKYISYANSSSFKGAFLSHEHTNTNHNANEKQNNIVKEHNMHTWSIQYTIFIIVDTILGQNE